MIEIVTLLIIKAKNSKWRLKGYLDSVRRFIIIF